MFTAKKNIQFIDYQNSYYYRQKRKKCRNKWVTLLFVMTAVAVLVLFFVPIAQANQLPLEKLASSDNALINGPQLMFEHPNPSMGATFPVDIEANIEINGLVAYAEIKQTFINPHAISLAGKYQFPLPESAAVKQLKIQMGDKEIVGEIMEKKAAKRIYKKAKQQGRKASLVEQQRPNLFTNKIANIPAQSTVIVTLKFIMPITFLNGNYNLRLPLAITQRYQPKDYNQESDLSEYMSKHWSKQSHQQLPEPFKLKTTNFPYHQSQSIARSQSSINIVLNSGVAITGIYSDSHKITSQPVNGGQNAYFIALDKAQVTSNKSFDLRWQLVASNQPQVSSFTQEVLGEHYTLLTIFPPKTEAAKIIARDLIFIIDTSGSMQGSSIAQAKASLQSALLALNSNDSFNIIAFDNETELLFPMTEMATKPNISKAKAFIDDLTADGGTQMYRPLSSALMMKKNMKQSTKAIRQIIFITDGAVANEFELMQLLNIAKEDFRLYTIGIGAAPNGYFMKKAAQFGRGSYVFIQNHTEVERKMSQFMTKISQPAISDINLSLANHVNQHVEIYPEKLPDLYFGEPLQIAIKSNSPITSAQLSAQTASTPWYQQLLIDENQSSKGISSLWARRKIESLLDSLVIGANKEMVKSEVISTSITHQMISPYTSFIAVEKLPEPAPLLTKNNAIQSHESLLVAAPQTAIGWQLQFLIGLLLLLLVKICDFYWLFNRDIKKVICRERHH